MSPDKVIDLRNYSGRASAHERVANAALAWRPLWLACGWGLVALVIYLSLTPEPVQLNVESGDKIGHVLAYLALMSWFANLFEEAHRRAQIAVAFVAMAVALEFVQRWTGYRSFELADMAAGAIGVALGWAFAPPRLPNYLRLTEKVLHRS